MSSRGIQQTNAVAIATWLVVTMAGCVATPPPETAAAVPTPTATATNTPTLEPEEEVQPITCDTAFTAARMEMILNDGDRKSVV